MGPGGNKEHSVLYGSKWAKRPCTVRLIVGELRKKEEKGESSERDGAFKYEFGMELAHRGSASLRKDDCDGMVLAWSISAPTIPSHVRAPGECTWGGCGRGGCARWGYRAGTWLGAGFVGLRGEIAAPVLLLVRRVWPAVVGRDPIADISRLGERFIYCARVELHEDTSLETMVPSVSDSNILDLCDAWMRNGGEEEPWDVRQFGYASFSFTILGLICLLFTDSRAFEVFVYMQNISEPVVDIHKPRVVDRRVL